MKKNKYRYFYFTLSKQLIRVDSLNKGFWYDEGEGNFIKARSEQWDLGNIIAWQGVEEVTLYQGLHYTSGNYIP